MIIAQLSDLHVLERGRTISGQGIRIPIDTNGGAQAAIAHIRRSTPAPDVVVVTGDVTWDGQPAQYEMARELLEALGVDYYVIPGNHDVRESLVRTFEGRLDTSGGFVQYAVDRGEVRLVGIDTLDEGNDAGLLCDERLAWLDRTLAGAPDRPTFVFMHHPPFETGIWWMDTAGLFGTRAFGDVIGAHPQVVHIACGHVHRTMAAIVAGRPATMAPALAYHVALDLRHEGGARFVREPAAYHVHRFGGGSFVTHVAYVDEEREIIDLARVTPDWDAKRAQWRERAAGLH